MKLIMQDAQIVAEASDEYTGPQAWIEAPADYEPGSFLLPGPTPAAGIMEVPRWAGKLALMRHVMDDGQLRNLAEAEARPDDNLLARVLAYRDSLPAGERVDRIDVALNDAKDWTRNSPTVAMMASIIPLADAQLDALFVWANAQLGAV